MRVLVVDNYDSFAYNLVQYVGEVVTSESWLASTGAGGSADASAPTDDEVVVRRNDAVDVAAVRALDPDAIVVSPGPGTPEEAGVSVPLFAELAMPTLGVCLGHQALCVANGGTVDRAPRVVHGKPSTVSHDGEGVFTGLPDPIEVGRYHSLAVEPGTLPDALTATARTVGEAGAPGDPRADGERDGGTGGDGRGDAGDGGGGDASVVMAVRHRELPHVGVQFHPESILTDAGKDLIGNFLRMATGDR